MPQIQGNTMEEKHEYIKSSKIHKKLREALMLEPRGFPGMFGAILTPPCNPQADWGIIFMNDCTFLPGCGHGTIGAATVLTELGMVNIKEPETAITFDTAAGLVSAHAVIEAGKTKRVWFDNVPSFLHQSNVLIDIPKLGKVNVDIAFGGNFYAIVPVEQFDMLVETANISILRGIGLHIVQSLSEQVKIQHPIVKELDYCEIVIFIGPPSHPEELPAYSARQMTVVGSRGRVGRCPCGTGTSARLSALYNKGVLKLGETIFHESLIGTFFQGQVIREIKLGHLKAIIPRISGSAHITGIQQFVIDPEDPLKYGFAFEGY
jgi:proline racemase